MIMQLRAILFEMNILAVHGATTAEITGICCVARRVLPGDLYFAVAREHENGEADIELAVERGAAAVVSRKMGKTRFRVPRVEVTDTRLALAEASAFFYGNAGAKLQIIGVAGPSSGWKTADLTKKLLESAGVKTGLICSLRHEVGERTLPASPLAEVCDTQKSFAAMVRAGCTACVLELPSISPAALKGIPINVLVFAGGEQNLRALSVFVQERSAAPICGIVNCDDESGRAVEHSSIFKMQLTYGFAGAAEVSASNLSFSRTATRFDLELAGSMASCELPLVGKENIHHLLGAAAASLSMLTPKQVFGAMAHLRSVPASLEPVLNDQGLTVFVDAAADVPALSELFASVKLLQPRRTLIVMGSVEGTPGKKRFDLGKVAGESADHVILTSDNPGTEHMTEICSAIAQGLEQSQRCTYHIQPDREQAIRDLISMTERGDIALILGKGERTYQIIGNTIAPFNDRETAAECLRTIPAPAPLPQATPQKSLTLAAA
jgi:UDP-N-acetylmuramoyl-L-alanyl-D-glutamate--2,6-diaminopimelate ligase